MGHSYSLFCTNCYFAMNISTGIGMLYPFDCEEILVSMKNGEYGEDFKNAANTPYAAIHLNNELFRCDQCGNLIGDSTIDLCAPSPGYIIYQERLHVTGGRKHDPKYYVSDYEVGSSYKVILSKTHLCSKCGNEMKPISIENSIACPVCKKELTVRFKKLWD